MRLFALSDLHLSFARPKPMDLFGPEWRDHAGQIERNWRRAVTPEDVVLVPGDHSWALRLEGALPDLQWLDRLPGRKVLVKGNHDYWWGSLGKLRRLGLETLHFVQHDLLVLNGIAFTGTRLWEFKECAWPLGKSWAETERTAPRTADTQGSMAATVTGREKLGEAEDEALRRRELERLRIGLNCLPQDARLRVVLLHYPPLGAEGAPTALTELLAAHRVDLCVFGHIHDLGERVPSGRDVTLSGTRYVLSSCDALGFAPKQVYP